MTHTAWWCAVLPRPKCGQGRGGLAAGRTPQRARGRVPVRCGAGGGAHPQLRGSAPGFANAICISGSRLIRYRHISNHNAHYCYALPRGRAVQLHTDSDTENGKHHTLRAGKKTQPISHQSSLLLSLLLPDTRAAIFACSMRASSWLMDSGSDASCEQPPRSSVVRA